VILLAIAVTAAAGYGAAELQQRSFAATSSVVVSSQISGRKGPGRAWEANRLAITLATALPEDDRLLARIGTAIDRPVEEVGDHLSAVNPPDTAVVRLRYRDDEPEVAEQAARTAALAVVGPSSVTPAAPPGSIELLQLARTPDQPGDSTTVIVAIAAALGLVLGLVLALAWERADPRIEDFIDCIALTGLPTTDLNELTPPAAVAMLERWLDLSERRSVRMAIVPATRRAAALAPPVAQWLVGMHRGASGSDTFQNGGDPDPAEQATQEALASRSATTSISGGRGERPRRPFRRRAPSAPVSGPPEAATSERIELVAGTQPGSGSAGEVEALRSDVISLLVTRGTRGRDVARAGETMTQYGHRPDWILFVQSPRRLQTSMR
jgi:hypothetical protein